MSEAIDYKEFNNNISGIIDSFVKKASFIETPKEERKFLCKNMLDVFNNKTKAAESLGISRRTLSRYLDSINKIDLDHIFNLSILQEYDNETIKYWCILMNIEDEPYRIVTGTEREIELSIMVGKAIGSPYIVSYAEECMNKDEFPKQEISQIRNLLVSYYEFMQEKKIELCATYKHGIFNLEKI